MWLRWGESRRSSTRYSRDAYCTTQRQLGGGNEIKQNPSWNVYDIILPRLSLSLSHVWCVSSMFNNLPASSFSSYFTLMALRIVALTQSTHAAALVRPVQSCMSSTLAVIDVGHRSANCDNLETGGETESAQLNSTQSDVTMSLKK